MSTEIFNVTQQTPNQLLTIRKNMYNDICKHLTLLPLLG